MFSTLTFVLCPTHFVVDDILATVLALYMHDKQQPLPSHAEVLLCTPDTTTEEVRCTFRQDFLKIFSYFNTDIYMIRMSSRLRKVWKFPAHELSGSTTNFLPSLGFFLT